MKFLSLIRLLIVFFLLAHGPIFAVTLQELIGGFNEVKDKKSPYTARPITTDSPQEALDVVKDHCREMINYHQEMVEMFQNRQERYKRYLDNGVGTPQLDLFLQCVLDIDRVKGTPPKDILLDFISQHNFYKDNWMRELAILTNETQTLSDNSLFDPKLFYANRRDFNLRYALGSYTSFQKKIQDFNTKFPMLQKLPREQFTACQLDLDYLWSLKYVCTVLLPWAKPDNELPKTSIQVTSESPQLNTKDQQFLQDASVKAILLQQKQKQKKTIEKKKNCNTRLPSRPTPYVPRQEEKPVHDQDKHPLNSKQETEQQTQQEISLLSILLDKPKARAEENVSETQPRNEVVETFLNVEHVKQVEEEEKFDIEEYIKSEKSLSLAKKKDILATSLTPTNISNNDEECEKVRKDTILTPMLQTRSFEMDKKSYGYFMDLFQHKTLAFEDFEKAVEKGLKGKMYQNKGGSMRTFQIGKFSFVLHQPHGYKGKPSFYEELRNRAIRQLERLGVTKETIVEGKVNSNF